MLEATTEKRGSSEVVKAYRKIMNTVRNSEIMQKQWDNYQKDFEYATDIAFVDVCDTVVKLMDSLKAYETPQGSLFMPWKHGQNQ